jgi:tripartite-type tricarboxylate transporter receptor subunit TctC
MRRYIVSFTFILISCLSLQVNAQSYPNRVIKLVVPFPPGGLIDNAARLIGPELSKELGQPVVIENKPGAGGNLAAADVAKASPDGYTLLMASAPLSISPALYKTLPYNPASIEPIAVLGQLPNVLMVNPESGINTVADLVKRARANPGKLNYASNGNGTSLHLSAEMLKNQAGIFVVHIPYRGSTFANVGLVSKEVDFMFDNLPPALGLINGNKLKPLAVATLKRTELAPEIPTVVEQGFPGFEIGAWLGLFGPVGLPPAIQKTLLNEINLILQEPETRAKLAKGGAEVRTSASSPEFAVFLKNDYENTGKLIRDFNIKPME